MSWIAEFPNGDILQLIASNKTLFVKDIFKSKDINNFNVDKIVKCNVFDAKNLAWLMGLEYKEMD